MYILELPNFILQNMSKQLFLSLILRILLCNPFSIVSSVLFSSAVCFNYCIISPRDICSVKLFLNFLDVNNLNKNKNYRWFPLHCFYKLSLMMHFKNPLISSTSPFTICLSNICSLMMDMSPLAT